MKRTLAFIAIICGWMSRSHAGQGPLEPLAFLAGHCWEGEFAEGGSWDKHCFEWEYDGRFLRDRHVVTGKRAPYSGETFYRFDSRNKRIVFHYFNSQGGYSEGVVEPSDSELKFPEERYTQGGKETVLRTVWKLDGATRYIAITEQQRDGEWREAWRIAFVRIQ